MEKVMISAHMDQIGLMVIDIDEKGFFKIYKCWWNISYNFFESKMSFFKMELLELSMLNL